MEARMERMPWHVRIYVLGIPLLALVLIAWQWAAQPLRLGTPDRWIPFLLGTGLVAVFSARPIPLPRNAHMSLGCVFGLTALCLFDPTLGIVLFVSGLTLGYLYNYWRRRRPAWFQILFSIAAQALSLDIGAEVYLLLHWGDVNPTISWHNALVFILGGAVFVALNVFFVAAAISLSEGIRLWEVILLNYHGSLILFVSHVPLSGIVLILYQSRPWAVLLIFLPLIAIHLSYSNLERLNEAARRMLRSLATLVDARDPHTARHSGRVAKYALAIAQEMRVSFALQDTLRMAATIHDLGKLTVPEEILWKPGKLDANEWERVRSHPTVGAYLVDGLPLFDKVQEIMRCHHERFDGTGYPDGTAGEEIPLGARILAVADALDAITAERPYRRTRTLDEALEDVQVNAGTQFDPVVVDAAVTAWPRLEELYLAVQAEEAAQPLERKVGVPTYARPGSQGQAAAGGG
jgi:putative nucleotidyltransferase with HDIG domain